MDEPRDTPRLGSGPVAVQRSCDDCRARKIRCDRGSPCSHCRAAGLACRTTAQRPREARDRVQITKQYESKIDRIESRLASIEHLLRSSPHAPSPGRSASPGVANNLSRVEDDSEAQESTKGDIGPQGDSVTAKDVLERTVGQDFAMQQDLQLMSALDSLRNIVRRTQAGASAPADAPSKTSAARRPSPEFVLKWQDIKPLLDRAEMIKPMSFNMLPQAVFDDFRKSSRTIFQHGHPGKLAERILVYSGMSNLCFEISGTNHEDSGMYYHDLGTQFCTLLTETLDTFTITTPASMEMVESLAVATLTTNGMCRPSLSWTLSCTAARMCQSLGYNRLSNLQPKSDPAFSRKVTIFWCLYVLDRNNALRLGHAPAFHDDDIDTPAMSPENGHIPAILALKNFWVESSKLQGKIYMQLCGPAARSLAPSEKARLAEEFADNLEAVYQSKVKMDSRLPLPLSDLTPDAKGAALWMRGDEMIFLTILTTALCAIPFNHPRRFRAIETARRYLQTTRDISRTYVDNIFHWAAFCHWIILRAPLTPFAGVFCNVVAHPHSAQADLELLDDFVTCIEPACEISPGVGKLHQLLSIFVQAAHAYVQAKRRQEMGGLQGEGSAQYSSQDFQPAISDFDEQLQALGLFGPLPATVADGRDMTESPAGPEEGQTLQMLDVDYSQDWYTGNVSMYGLLEQDFGHFQQDMLLEDAGF